MVVSDQARAAGAASIPDPGATGGDPDADWFLYQPVQLSLRQASTIGIHPQYMTHWTVDSKAMRKVGPNQDIVGMFSEEGNFGAVLTTQGRSLIQLH